MATPQEQLELKKAIESKMQELKGRIRIHKIVATRSIRTPTGDIFCGLSASFAHDGLGAGTDLVPSDEEEREIALQGLTAKDAVPAYLFLQHRAYKLCLRAAKAEGSILENVAESLEQEAEQRFHVALTNSLVENLRVPSPAPAPTPENVHDAAANSGG